MWHCLLEFFFPGPRSSCLPGSVHIGHPQYPLNCFMQSHDDLAGASMVVSSRIPGMVIPDSSSILTPYICDITTEIIVH